MSSISATGWCQVPLGEVVTLHYGKALDKSDRDPNGSVPVYGANGIKDRSDKWLVRGPALIVGRKGSAGEITREDGLFWPLDVSYYTSHDSSRIDFEFLQYALTTLDLPSMARGVKPGINRNDVYAIPMALPELEEQKRIVAVLDQAFAALDRARAHAEANLTDARLAFKRITTAIFMEVSNCHSSELLVAQLAEERKGSIRTGPFGSQLKHGEFVEKGIFVLGIDNAVKNSFQWGKARHITKEKYAELARYRVFPGDVVITIMGTCGRCAVIPEDIPLSINTKHLCCITLDKKKCYPEYLHRYFLLSPKALTYLETQSKGTVMDGLNMGIIKELPVDLPSVNRQKEICARIDELETHALNLQQHYSACLEDLADLRQSLLQKAFSGQLT